MRLDQMAHTFLLDEGSYVEGLAHWRDQDYDGPCSLIDADRTEELADALMRFVAEVVVSIIDAGSEREAVLESEKLREALLDELRGWDSREWRREQLDQVPCEETSLSEAPVV